MLISNLINSFHYFSVTTWFEEVLSSSQPWIILSTAHTTNSSTSSSYLPKEIIQVTEEFVAAPIISMSDSNSSSNNDNCSNSSSFFNLSTIIAIISTTALIYTQWASLPEWVTLGSSSTNSNNNEDGDNSGNSKNDLDKDANDDLANMKAIYTKLKEMMSIVHQVCNDSSVCDDSTNNQQNNDDDDDENNIVLCDDPTNKEDDSVVKPTTEDATVVMSDVEMMAAFYSLIHLNKEIITKDPDYRDKQFDMNYKNQVVNNNNIDELKEIAEYLEYAQWAYEDSHAAISKNCRQAGLDLITHDTATEPGRVGHYIAFQHTKKLAIIGLKGTSTISDILTDLIAIPKVHVGCQFIDDDNPDVTENMRVHEGIFTAAMWMADNIQPMIENLLLPMQYKVIICGHSLGAGTACLLGLELRSRIKEFRKNYTDLRVLAYATPPVLSYRASKACAPFITSIVNNTDVIPRSSIANLIVMNKLLIRIHEKLIQKGSTFNLYSWTSLKKYYEEHTTIDDDLILSEQEMDDFFEETHAEPENEKDVALFVPGRCVVMWDKGDNDNNEIGYIVTDCGMKMLRQIELSLTLINDHFLKGYRKNLHKLIEQLENNNNNNTSV